ncbi:glucosyl-3-phosphoglycerate synthase [Nocardioides panacihumi]|uniref:Glucosyl-3-phosphoglycerate synthase n=1 Tax=Nocardioides panacihumi TaxID=400774 RepID=A0ABN2RKX2_9ACTN
MPRRDSRTFRWNDWSLDELLAAKGEARVSLVVPAKDEASTVGAMIESLRSVLMGAAALVDELVVIDSDSTDATARVAADAGAVVHAASAIRPELGSYPGKGEAMWKSQFVTTGDLIVFMDADLVEWDTHFVPGLLGPLLTRPGIELVKGFYRRPGQHGLDGGRVTELVARPLIALDFPELADLVQPLAGEWAIRRTLFESLSVPTGYAVELASLIDTARLRGIQTIAQVDLGRRSHRHQELLDLGVMATQILSAVARRSGGRDLESVTLQQFRPSEDAIASSKRTVLVAERPPAKEIA